MSKLNSITVSDLFFTKPSYERNISDIKNIYFNQLIRILTPCVFDSFKLIYNKAVSLAHGSMSVEYAFKICLKDLITLSPTSIANEVAKIKQLSKSGSYFDNLVKSVIKSHIVLLSYNVSKESCPICTPDKYNIDINRFIHECYIEIGNSIFNDPRVFIMCLKDGDGLNNVNDNIRVGNKFDKLVKKSVSKVIFDFIPVNDILHEYLNKEKITDEGIQATKEMEKEQMIEDIVNGVVDKLSNVMPKNNVNVDEIVEKLKGVVKREGESENIVIENPVDINQPVQETYVEPSEHSTVHPLVDVENHGEKTIDQINAVISNDISVKESIEEKEDEKNDKEEDEEGEDDAKEIVNEDDDKEIMIGESDLITNEKIEGGDNEMQEEINAANVEEVNEDVKEDVKEVAKEEVIETPKRRGRPKRFTNTITEKNSLDKFK